MTGPTVSLLELRDEFGFVRNDANYADVAKAIASSSVKVVLVRGKKNKGVAGAISETHFLKVCASGIDPARTFARDKMQTDLLRLRDRRDRLRVRALRRRVSGPDPGGGL